jgi:hypothetical protein
MSYETYRDVSATGAAHIVPSYVLYVDQDGDITTDDDRGYLIFEPVYTYGNDSVKTGKWQFWDVLNNGDSAWWGMNSTRVDYTDTWSEILAQYENATVLAYGFNQGTGNPGAITAVQSLDFDCATTTFGNGSVLPDDDENETDSPSTDDGNVLGTGIDKSKTQILGASTGLPATIPATGNASNPFIILVASLAAYGAAYFAQGRRNLGRKASLDL